MPSLRCRRVTAFLVRPASTALAALAAACAAPPPAPEPALMSIAPDRPYVVVLGTAQDAGSPQVNSPRDHPGRVDPAQRRLAVALGIVDPATGRRWMIDATPDFREQAWALSRAAPDADEPIRLDGVFVTHAHVGHYTGLMFLGHESMGARGVPTWAMPRMADFLSSNGPWDQLVRYGNVDLRPLADGVPVELGSRITVTPFLVPHRQEYAEVVGFRVEGPGGSVVWLPDIDSWDEWAAQGTRLRDVVERTDVVYVDATFFADGEIPGRDMSRFPHPRIVETMDRLEHLAPADRAGVRFIHLNHTNPAQWPGTPERAEIERRGFRVAERGERVGL